MNRHKPINRSRAFLKLAETGHVPAIPLFPRSQRHVLGCRLPRQPSQKQPSCLAEAFLVLPRDTIGSPSAFLKIVDRFRNVFTGTGDFVSPGARRPNVRAPLNIADNQAGYSL